ncbi:MAG: hypothetical protein WA160_08790 [Pseudobdellovibrio sp.]
MKNKITLIQLAALVLLFTSCMPKSATDAILNQKSSGYTYDLTENGCPTGEHSFSSLESMCDGLKNDSLNNFCARNLRYSKFQSDCPGRTW